MHDKEALPCARPAIVDSQPMTAHVLRDALLVFLLTYHPPFPTHTPFFFPAPLPRTSPPPPLFMHRNLECLNQAYS